MTLFGNPPRLDRYARESVLSEDYLLVRTRFLIFDMIPPHQFLGSLKKLSIEGPDWDSCGAHSNAQFREPSSFADMRRSTASHSLSRP